MAGNLAGTETNSFTPPELFVGGAPVITKPYTFATGQSLEANSVVAFNTSGQLVEWAPGAGDSTNKAVGITCEAVNTSAGAAANPIYEGGYFNTDAINWPDGTTATQKQGAFVGTDIHHRSLAYSG